MSKLSNYGQILEESYANGSVIQQSLFPPTSQWSLPEELPNLRSAKIIGLDIETKDPDLRTKGPGVRRDGYIIGISVSIPEGKKWYLPFGHSTGKQFDKGSIIKWAKDNLCEPNQAKVGANILYDLDYLYHEGVKVTGPFFDIQIAEPLIDENKFSYSLDNLAKEYLNESKNESLITNICKDYGLKGKPQEHLWRLDPKYVGEYAESDSEQALRIFAKQQKIIKSQKLEEIFDIETRLIPMLLHMRQVGVPIDMDRLLKLHDTKTEELKLAINELNSMAGGQVDYWAAESIAKVFDRLGEPYPMTPKTKKPSFKKDWLERHDSEIAEKIVRCRTIDKFIGTFLEGSLLEMLVGNRIHCQFNQLRSDDSGTVTGRFSSSNPNLQFIPTRTEEGKEIRKCFIPDDIHNWCKADYSQIEIRILAHYAMGRGSDDVRKAFHKDKNLDYHQWCADRRGISRREAKTINFGIIYGMGVYKLATQLGIHPDEAATFRDDYYAYLPFLKKTVQTATEVAEQRGYVKTLLGRRRRFDMWEPRDSFLRKVIPGNRDRDELIIAINDLWERYPGQYETKKVQRAGCYKAFNSVDQGTAADIMKKAMVDVWEAGLCDVIRPYITVHDELDYGYPISKIGDEANRECKRLMEQTVPLKVPVVVDQEVGPNWGDLEDL